LQVVKLQGTGGPTLLIHVSVAGVTNTALAFSDNGMAYTAPGLLALDRIHVS